MNKDIQLLELFKNGFQNNNYTRLEHPHDLKIYVGADDKGMFAIKLAGQFKPERITSSYVITVQQMVQGDDYALIFSLGQAELLEYFCAFCKDLITSVQDMSDTNEAYKGMSSRYFAWKKLFRSTSTKLTEKEIMGLLAELLFLKEQLMPNFGVAMAVDAWSGPEKLHKDFSLKDIWFEVKAISTGKDSVRISSLEQLDSQTDGTLCVYRFEKMSPAFAGLKLNQVVLDIIQSLSHSQEYELFMGKLEKAGYTWIADYDNYVYNIIEIFSYAVTNEFPRLKRTDIPMAISKVQYEILLSEIETFKTTNI